MKLLRKIFTSTFTFTFTILILFAKISSAAVTFTASGYSTAVVLTGQTTPTYYFSNISLNTTDASSLNYIVDGGGTSGCPNARNPQCLNSAAQFVLNAASSVQKAGTTGTMTLVVSAVPLTTTNFNSQSLSAGATANVGSYVLLSQNYGGAATPVTIAFPNSFATLCDAFVKAATAGSLTPTIDSSCGLAAGTPGHGGTATGATIYLNIILQTAQGTSNYSADANSDIGNIQLVIDSAIPKYSTLSPPLGFYDWTAFPGDGEIHIKNITVDTRFPTSENGVPVQTVRFFYNSTGFSNLDVGSPSQDLTITGANGTTPTLSSYYITNLLNGTKYFFRASMIDNAGNIGFLTFDDVNSHAAAPDQIAGLLSKNGNCFIATAAFGSPLASQVGVLRKFRDSFLMSSRTGRNFVSYYYKQSPSLAKKLAAHEGARFFVRLFLYPLVGFSWVALHWGLTNALLLLICALLFPLLLLKKRELSPLLEKRGRDL
jgi:hypothetical protein